MALELADRPPSADLTRSSSACARRSGVEEAVLVTASGRAAGERERGRHQAGARAADRPGAAPGARQPRLRRGRRARRAAAVAARRSCRSNARGIAEEARFLQLRAERAAVVRAQRRGGRGGLPRLPRARDLARRAEAHLRRHADLRPADGAVRRRRGGRDAVQPARRAARQPRAGDAGGGARRFLAPGAGHQPRRARRADRIVQLDDAASSTEARRVVESNRARARGGEGAAREHPRQPVGRACWCSTTSSSSRSPTTARGDPRRRARGVRRAHARAVRRARREGLAARARS